MADSDNRDQDPEELREPPSSSVDKAKYTQTDRDFDEADSHHIADLSQETPFKDWVDLSGGEALYVFPTARLNQFGKERTSYNANDLYKGQPSSHH